MIVLIIWATLFEQKHHIFERTSSEQPIHK